MFSLQSMWPELHSMPDSIVWHQQFIKKTENTEGQSTSEYIKGECVTEFRSGELK